MFVLLAFLAPILHALSCIVDAHFSNNVFKKISSIVFFATVSNIIIIPLLFCFGCPSLPSPNIMAIVFIIACIDVLYQIPYYIALRNIDTSIIVALFSLGKIAVPILAYFIVNEKLTYQQYIGFTLIILSTFILNFDIKKFKLNVAFFLMLIVSLCLSFQSVMSKYTLQSVDFITVLFWESIFVSFINLSFLVLPKSRTDIIRTFPSYIKQIKLFLLNEVLSQGGTLAMTVALAHLPVLIIKSINASQSIFTLIFGIILYKLFGDKFKENLTVSNLIKKLVSFIVIIIGIYMVLK